MEPAPDAFACLSTDWSTPVRGTTVLRIEGELELFTVPQLRRAVAEQTGAPAARLVIDLSAVRFLDSAGISELIAVYKRFRNHHEVCLVPPGGACGHLLERMQITRFFAAFATVEQALDAPSEAADPEPTGSPRAA